MARSVSVAAGFTPGTRHPVNDWGTLAALVEAGRGLHLIPRMAQPLCAQRELTLLTTEDATPSRNAFAAVRTSAERRHGRTGGAERDPVPGAVRDQLKLSVRDLYRPTRASNPALHSPHSSAVIE